MAPQNVELPFLYPSPLLAKVEIESIPNLHSVLCIFPSNTTLFISKTMLDINFFWNHGQYSNFHFWREFKFSKFFRVTFNICHHMAHICLKFQNFRPFSSKVVPLKPFWTHFNFWREFKILENYFEYAKMCGIVWLLNRKNKWTLYLEAVKSFLITNWNSHFDF